MGAAFLITLREGIEAAERVRRINRKIVLLSIGMSNASDEFSAFKRSADRDPQRNSSLVVVDGAQDGFDSRRARSQPVFWENIDQSLGEAEVTPEQVQAVWLKQAVAGEHRRFPKDARALQSDLRAILRIMRVRYPNVKLVYLSSRTYGGYAITGLNPEPAAYDSVVGSLRAELPVTVPGCVDGWAQAYAYSREGLRGRLPWEELLLDAIQYAEDGFPVTRSQEAATAHNLDPADEWLRHLQRFEGFRKAYLRPDGRPFPHGHGNNGAGDDRVALGEHPPHQLAGGRRGVAAVPVGHADPVAQLRPRVRRFNPQPDRADGCHRHRPLRARDWEAGRRAAPRSG